MIDFTHEDTPKTFWGLNCIMSSRDKKLTWPRSKSLEDISKVEHDEIKVAEYDAKLEEAINTVFEDDVEEESDGYGEDD